MAVSNITEFTCFSELHYELRKEIWEICLPRRVIEVDYHLKWEGQGAPYTSCQMRGTTKRNGRPPIISRVCRESRQVALGHGGIFRFDQLSVPSTMDPEIRSALVHRAWVSHGLDVLYLNWHLRGGFTLFAGNEPVKYLFDAADATKAAGLSYSGTMLNNFGAPFDLTNIAIIQGEAGANDYDMRNFTLHKERQETFLVALQTVPLHMSTEQAVQSGLFGLLGEEPIKLVNFDDQESIQQYRDLWLSGSQGDNELDEFFMQSPEQHYHNLQEWTDGLKTRAVLYAWIQACHDKLPVIQEADSIWKKPDEGQSADIFQMQSFGMVERRIYNAHHPWVEKVLEEMPKIQPKIMFRHCEDKCCSEKL